MLVLGLAASALCKVRTSKRPGFMVGNPLYDPVWEDDAKIVGGYEVGLRRFMSFCTCPVQLVLCSHFERAIKILQCFRLESRLDY